VYPFHGSANVAVQDGDPDSLLSFYRDWIHLRNESPALLFGDTQLVDSDSNAVYALLRSTGKQMVLVLVNLSDEPLQEYALSLKTGALSGSYRLDALYGAGSFATLNASPDGGFSDYQPLPELPANSRIILELVPQN
jgi:glycosidase